MQRIVILELLIIVKGLRPNDFRSMMSIHIMAIHNYIIVSLNLLRPRRGRSISALDNSMVDVEVRRLLMKQTASLQVFANSGSVITVDSNNNNLSLNGVSELLGQFDD